MPSSALPNGTTWYVVVQCDNMNDKFEEVALLTTDEEEAHEKEGEIDRTYGKVGWVKTIVTYEDK